MLKVQNAMYILVILATPVTDDSISFAHPPSTISLMQMQSYSLKLTAA